MLSQLVNLIASFFNELLKGKTVSTNPPVVTPPNPPNPPPPVPVGTMGRPIASNGWLRTPAGKPLRGDSVAITYWPTQFDKIKSDAFWERYANKLQFNCIRLLCYGIPQYRVEKGLINPATGKPFVYDTARAELSPEKAIPILDAAIANAKKYGIYCVIDHHTLSMWNLETAKAWWLPIAERYKNETHVVFEISNEPVAQHNDQHYLSSDFGYQKALYNHIRQIAPATPQIMFTFMTLYPGVSADLSLVYPDVKPLGAGGLGVVGFHEPHERVLAEIPLIQGKGFPLFMSEWSTGGAYYLETVKSYNWKLSHVSNAKSFEKRGASWLTLGGLPNYPTQKDFYAGEGTTPGIAIRWQR